MSRQDLMDTMKPARRRFLLATAAAGVAAGATPAGAGERGRRMGPNDLEKGTDDDVLDQLRIADLVQRERAARDAGQWDEMASHYHPQSVVDVSWYRGDGAGFVAASRRNAATGRLSLHQLTPTIAKVAGSRATAETPCQLVSFVPLEGVDVCMVGTVRMLWRAQRMERRWLIAGLRIIYIRDYIVPCDPSRMVVIDPTELARYRPSYRFLSYVLARSPNRPRDDLPGVDLPETVEALRAGEAGWLAGA